MNQIKITNSLILLFFVADGVSIKKCWDSSIVQNSKTELIKSAYCTLLDIPHKSKIPEFGKIFFNCIIKKIITHYQLNININIYTNTRKKKSNFIYEYNILYITLNQLILTY